MAVRIPIGAPASDGTSATSAVSTSVITTPITTAATTASSPIVVYWRRMKATAPSKIVSATSSISFVPVSRERTSRARYKANSTAMMPAGRMISWSALASIRVFGSSSTGLTAAIRPGHARRAAWEMRLGRGI